MTDVAVVVPWSPADPQRVAVWNWLRPLWVHRPVFEGTLEEGPWCKAAAVAAAVARTDAKVLVIADADVWTTGVDEAIRQVASRSARWAVPHRTVRRLNARATADVLDGTRYLSAPLGAEDLAERPYTGHAGGGIVVVRADVYRDCPLDPRFVGWGQEDDSWALALSTLHGAPWRGSADLHHLWHPPQDRLSRRLGSPEGRALANRYARANRRPAAMRELLEEVLPCRTS